GFGKLLYREAVYVEHCDWVLLLNILAHEGKAFHIVYDCQKNRWMLLSCGALSEKLPGPGRGLMYDAKRKLVYIMSEDGAAFALRIDLATAKTVDTETAVSK